jgi:hypothetical protein
LGRIFDRPQFDGIIDTLERVGTDRNEWEMGSATNQGAHRVRDEYLPTVCPVAHPRRHGYRKPDYIAVVRGDLAGVDPDPHADVAGLIGLAVVEQNALLDALTSNHRVDRGIEDGKSAIAEVLDEPTAGGGQSIADDPVVLDTDLIRDVIAKSFTQTR